MFKYLLAGEGIQMHSKNALIDIIQLQPECFLGYQVGIDGNALSALLYTVRLL